jgi:ketosteroid isomerase-like protein
MEDQSSIKAAIEQFIAAYNNGNLNGVLACYSDDLIKTRNGAPAENKSETARRLADVFANFHSRVEVENEELIVSGNYAFTRGSFRVTLKPKNGGDSAIIERRYLELWQKEDGRWLVMRTMDNQAS